MHETLYLAGAAGLVGFMAALGWRFGCGVHDWLTDRFDACDEWLLRRKK